MSLVSLLNSEPIAGYKVTERLGAGGYGEVWKVEAPGGLYKAIKFIYGYLTDEKAARELAALNRIKQVRHPFLLSLERIEVIDGQLMIVTELADMSLKDRFQACTEQGLTAIPREELLANLRDAADALDFLAENTLQHLDVKPENLLLVGGRVKVADFGLVREIQDGTCSMMGGMTPVYAAPESFDGRPNANSDQYSLAIVYQELLTGVLPFPGATAAQLASQHLHSRPRLESLPPCDRGIVEKALSKRGAERFKNCRALIDALLAAGRSTAGIAVGFDDAAPSLANRDTGGDDGQETDAAAPSRVRPTPSPERRTPIPRLRRTPVRGAEPDVPPAESRTKTAPPANQQPVVDLPRFRIEPDETGLRPTLFVGIGGTGGRVLRQLRRRLEDRFGDLSKVPALRTVLVDTDCQALAQQSPGDDSHGGNGEELLAMPLRKPQEYRAESVDILQWLSRRWLYNIPRSLQTEGFRPLGRLALVDHAKPLLERLRKTIAAVTSEEAAASSQERTGLGLRDRTPRAFIVASISGGTGSGMVLEVAYAVRTLLAELGLSDAGVCAVLVHSTERKAAAKSLAIANAYACLSELNHYARSRYPGEPACGLPGFERDRASLPAYFVHLGENLNEDDYAQATDALAEYLYLDAATAGGAFFDKCRAAVDGPENRTGVQLRTFGLCQLAGAAHELAKKAAESACLQLLERWTSGPKKGAAPAADGRAESIVQRLAKELKLGAQSLTTLFQAAADRVLLPNRPAAIERLTRFACHELTATALENFEVQWRGLTELMNHMLGLADPSGADFEDPPVLELATTVDAECKQIMDSLGDRLGHEILTAADEPELRLPGALKVTVKLVEFLRGLEADLSAEQRSGQEQLAALGQPPVEPAAASRRSAKTNHPATLDRTAIAERLVAHCGLSIDQHAVGAALRLVRGLVHRMSSLSDTLAGMRRDLAAIARGFAPRAEPTTQAPTNPADAADTDTKRALAKELDSRMAGVFAKLEKRVDREILSPVGGLARLATGPAEDLQKLPGRLRIAARTEVGEAMQQIDIAKIVAGPPADAGANRNRLGRGVQKARPQALKCGGGKRLLLVMPPCESAEHLVALVEQEHQEQATVIFDADCGVIACYEAQDLPITGVAGLISNDDPTCAEAARRLHTRVDVQWSPL